MGDAGTAISGIVNAGVNAYTDSKNLKFQKEAQAQNLAQQKEEFAYQKELNKMTMQREDTAIQRQAKDYEAAGFNRLLATEGGGASASSLSTYQSAGVEPVQSNLNMNLQTLDMVGGIVDFAMDIKQRKADIEKTNQETNYIKGQIDHQNIVTDIEKINKLLKDIELEHEPYRQAAMITEWLKSEAERKQKILDYQYYNELGLPSDAGVPEWDSNIKSLIKILESGDMQKIQKIIPEITKELTSMLGPMMESLGENVVKGAGGAIKGSAKGALSGLKGLLGF